MAFRHSGIVYLSGDIVFIRGYCKDRIVFRIYTLKGQMMTCIDIIY